MSIYSMTGFARAQVRVPFRDQDQIAYTLTVKSVNHRFLDVQLRLPSGLDALEMELRRIMKEKLVRGHVDLTLSIDRTSQQKAGYNRELVEGYLAAFSAAREEHGLGGQPDLNTILRLPGALQTDNRSNGDEDLDVLSASAMREIVPLLEQLNVMRAREGESLAAILHATLDRLAEATHGVAELRPEVEQRYQDRLTQRLEAATGAEFNRQRLLEEDMIEAVVGLAPNIFYGTGLAPAVVFLRRTKPTDRRQKVLIVDAASLFRKGRAQNFLDPEHAQQIIDWVRAFANVENRARVVTIDEVKAQDWALNISRYVLPPIDDDLPSLSDAVAAFKQALADARAAEDHLRTVLVEGGWLE